MENKTVYPEWVQNYRMKGTTVKKIGNSYYLYKRTSRRVPGKKYPQPVDTYIGVITPEGVLKSTRKKIDLTGIEVKEYGFSRTLQTLCPKSWKEPLGELWEEVFLLVVKVWSPESYLLKDRELKSEEELRCQTAAQAGMLKQKLSREHGVKLEELESLKKIYILYMKKGQAVSRISDEQEELLKKIGVDMSMC